MSTNIPYSLFRKSLKLSSSQATRNASQAPVAYPHVNKCMDISQETKIRHCFQKMSEIKFAYFERGLEISAIYFEIHNLYVLKIFLPM